MFCCVIIKSILSVITFIIYYNTILLSYLQVYKCYLNTNLYELHKNN